MQIRSLVAVAAVGVVAVGGLAPAVAAPKAKPFAGSYTLTLTPDPTPNAFNQVQDGSCFNVNPASKDERSFKLPRAGKFQIVLDSPQEHALSDWDMYLLDTASGEQLGASNGGTAHEEISMKFKKATEVTISVCNLTGATSGKVTYKLT